MAETVYDLLAAHAVLEVLVILQRQSQQNQHITVQVLESEIVILDKVNVVIGAVQDLKKALTRGPQLNKMDPPKIDLTIYPGFLL